MIDSSSIDAQARTNYVCLWMRLDLRRLIEHDDTVGCWPLRRMLTT